MKTYDLKKVQSDISNIEAIDWGKVNPVEDFQYPWNPVLTASMSFKGCWNDTYFFFRFDVDDDTLHVFNETGSKEEVVLSDRVEIFFKINDNLSPYYCLEIDPHGRIYDYEANHYRKFNKFWSWPKGQIEVETEKNLKTYVVQGRISIDSLKKLELWNDGHVQAGLYRGDCLSLVGRNAEIMWVSWIHSETKDPDFHVASSFGELHFTD